MRLPLIGTRNQYLCRSGVTPAPVLKQSAESSQPTLDAGGWTNRREFAGPGLGEYRCQCGCRIWGWSHSWSIAEFPSVRNLKFRSGTESGTETVDSGTKPLKIWEVRRRGKRRHHSRKPLSSQHLHPSQRIPLSRNGLAYETEGYWFESSGVYYAKCCLTNVLASITPLLIAAEFFRVPPLSHP
ncbi:hypothetical protein-transmembrane prediction [Rhodopirellula baltica SH 1]|uniref:Uncharacterized protein n=1 Tax=Rhodopirellula baltica (strain DSM 10527 / NCIMB 13988 / SH1) TaxID=243090 RepID=Q7UT55_RHOBA|nr:hypothetical protein-transmembrane prediction [Rhodopirellula baltica SH 1]